MTIIVRFFTFKRFLEFKSVLLFPVISPSYKRTDLPREISVRKCVMKWIPMKSYICVSEKRCWLGNMDVYIRPCWEEVDIIHWPGTPEDANCYLDQIISEFDWSIAVDIWAWWYEVQHGNVCLFLSTKL